MTFWKIVGDVVLLSFLGALAWWLLVPRRKYPVVEFCTGCGEQIGDAWLRMGDGRVYCCDLCIPAVLRARMAGDPR